MNSDDLFGTVARAAAGLALIVWAGGIVGGIIIVVFLWLFSAGGK